MKNTALVVIDLQSDIAKKMYFWQRKVDLIF